MSRAARFTKINIIAAGVLLLSVVGGGAFLVAKPDHKPAPQQPVVQSASTEKSAPTDHITYQGEDGKTALDLLKTKASVQTKTSSFGDMVTSINGQDGGGSKYWTFYVNGQMAEVGAGSYITKNGETIEWKLQ